MSKEILEKYSIAFSVIVAGLIVAGTLVFVNWKSVTSDGVRVEPGVADNVQPGSDAYKNVKPVTGDDHIFGNKDARIKIVNFSDMQCPFCISFESTMKQIVEDYKGDVAWVYRQYPLSDLHPFAKPAAEASECIAEIGGDSKFWNFMDKFTEAITASSGSVDVVEIADHLGVDISGCYGKNKYDSRITDSIADANNSGFQGTPYSIVIADGKPVATINGAYPLEDIKKTVDQYLK